MSIHHSLATAFGLLGNIISFLVGLAPMPTFHQIYKKKSTESFQSLPYVISLFSAMIWIYYGLLKGNAIFLLTINSYTCIIQVFYIAAYFFYAPKKARITTMKLVLLINIFGFGTICLLTFYLAKGETRMKIIGYICMGLSLAVFVAPLGIVRKVIRTKSVEYMPFTLSVFLTLGAVAWFFYGLLIKDLNVAIPNVLGFIFGVLQMVLYLIYKYPKKVVEEPKLHNLSEHVVDVVKLSTVVCSEMNTVVPRSSATENEAIGNGDEIVKKQTEETKPNKNTHVPTNV